MAAPKTNQHASSKGKSCINSEECQFCTRKGLPILPVRYAVLKADSEAKALDSKKVKEFTDLTLDQTLKNGSVVAKKEMTEPVNKYVLRLLREGYVYLYDVEKKKWICYEVTSDAKFYQLPENGKCSAEKISFPQQCNREEHNPENASLITIPEPEKSKIIYFAYSEYPWPKNHLDMIASDAGENWRDENMQKIDINEWINNKDESKDQSFAIKLSHYNEIFELNPVYNHEKVKTCYKPDINIDGNFLYNVAKVTDFSDQNKSNPTDRSLILAFKDEIGIIDELNLYRNESVSLLKDNIIDVGSELRKKNNINSESVDSCSIKRRKILCKQAIDLFKEHYRTAYYKEESKDYKSELSDYIEQVDRITKHTKAHYLEQEEQLIASGRTEDAKSMHDLYLAQDSKRDDAIEKWKKRYWKTIEESTNDSKEDYTSDIEECYDAEELEKIYKDYTDKVNIFKQFLYSFDSDYSCWVDRHLKDAVGRYSVNDYGAGLGVSAVITNALYGGIQSAASESLWENLSKEIDSEDSIILKGFYNNNESLLKKAIKAVSSLDSDGKLETTTFLNWIFDVRKIQDESNSPVDGRKLTSDDIVNSIRPTQEKLADIISKAFSTLKLYEKTGVINTNLGRVLEKLVQYEILSYLSDPDISHGKKDLPTIISTKLTFSDYLAWLYKFFGVEKSINENGSEFKSNDNQSGNKFTPASSSDEVYPVVLLQLESSYPSPFSEEAVQRREDKIKNDQQDRVEGVEKSLESTGGYIANHTDDLSYILKGNHGAALTNSFGRSIAILLLTLNATNLYEDGFKKDNQIAYTQILGFSATVAFIGQNIVEGVAISKSIATGRSLEKSLISSAAWGKFDFWLDSITAGISVLDGFQKLSESSRLRAQGYTPSADNLKIMAEVSIISGAIVLAADLAARYISGAAVAAGLGPLGEAVNAVGFVFGAVTGFFNLLYGYWCATLVRPAVQQWINLSIVGKHEDVIINKFENSASEISGLKMVISGVDVNFSSESVNVNDFGIYNTTLDEMVYKSPDAEELYNKVALGKKILIKISIPKISSAEVNISLRSSNAADKLLNLSYLKAKDKSNFKVVGSRYRSLSKTTKSPEFTEVDGNYQLSFYRYFDKEISDGIFSLDIKIASKDIINGNIRARYTIGNS